MADPAQGLDWVPVTLLVGGVEGQIGAIRVGHGFGEGVHLDAERAGGAFLGQPAVTPDAPKLLVPSRRQIGDCADHARDSLGRVVAECFGRYR